MHQNSPGLYRYARRLWRYARGEARDKTEVSDRPVGKPGHGSRGNAPKVARFAQFRDSWLRTSAHRLATPWYSSTALASSPSDSARTDSWTSMALWSLSSSSQLNRAETPS